MISCVTLDNATLEKPYLYPVLPEDGIEYSGDWGKIQTEAQKDYITTIVLNPNNTGKTREMTIHFSYTWYVATITLKQEK